MERRELWGCQNHQGRVEWVDHLEHPLEVSSRINLPVKLRFIKHCTAAKFSNKIFHNLFLIRIVVLLWKYAIMKDLYWDPNADKSSRSESNWIQQPIYRDNECLDLYNLRDSECVKSLKHESKVTNNKLMYSQQRKI